MLNSKPMLTYEQQIQHFINKGVTFKHISQEDAAEYLRQNNNFFKLSAYRKNFFKCDGKDTYLNLDFSYLIDLAIIDTRLRMLIVEMSLNIEHFAKVQLLRNVAEAESEDGYSIVADYINSLDVPGRMHLQTEIERNQSSIYVCDIYKKYKQSFPIWAFVEILSFGSFIHFYKYCATRLGDKSMIDNVYLFLTVKKVRNASAHNNCLLNDLAIRTHKYKVNYDVRQALSQIGIKYNQRKRKMACERTAQVITCLYVHKRIVKSEGTHSHIASRLHEFKARLFRDFDYKFNATILTTFQLFEKTIDNWFSIV